MAKSKIQGITIEIGGNTQPLNKAIKEAMKASEGLAGELTQINKLLKVDPSNVDLLRQKQTVLNTLLDSTRKKLQLLEKAYKESTPEEVGEDAYRELERAVISAQNQVNKYEKQLNDTNDEIDNAGKRTNTFKNSIKEAGDESKKMSTTAKAAFAAVGAAIAAAGAKAISFLTSSVEESKELQGDMSRLEQNAKNAGMTLDDVAGSMEYLVGVTDEVDSSVEGLSNLMAAGFKGDQLTQAVDALSGAIIKFPDTLKVESLADSLQETLATGKATGQFAELLDRLGVSADSFSADLAKCTTQAEKQELALKTLADAGLSEINEEYKAANRSLLAYTASQFRYEQSVARLGKAMQPAMTAWQDAMTGVVDAATEVVETAQFEQVIEKIGDAIEDLTRTALPPLLDFVEFLADNSDMILTLITSIGAGFASWNVGKVISNMIGGFSSLTAMIKGTTTAAGGLNKVLAANPIGAVLSAVSALVPLITSSIDRASKASEEVQKLADAANDLKDSVEGSRDSFADTNAEIAAQADVAADLFDEMEKIKKSSGEASEKQAQLRTVGSQLKSIYPDLTQEIDNYVNGVEGSSDALRDAIKAAKEYSAAQAEAKFVGEMTDAYVEAEVAIRKTNAERNKLIQDLRESGVSDADIERMQELGETTSWVGTQFSTLNPVIQEGAKQFRAFAEADAANAETMDMASSAVSEYGIDFENAANTVAENGTTITDTVQSISDAEAALLLQRVAAGETLAEADAASLETWKTNNADRAAAMEEFYADQIAFYEGIADAAISSNEIIKTSEQQGFKDRAKALEENLATMQTFKYNYETMMSQLPEAGQKYLQTLGAQDAKFLQDMVDMWGNGGTDAVMDFVNNLESAYALEIPGVQSQIVSGVGEVGEAAIAEAEKFGGNAGERWAVYMQQKTAEQQEGLIDSAEAAAFNVWDATDRKIEDLDFPGLGKDICDDIAAGINSSVDTVRKAGARIASAIKSSMRVNGTVSATMAGSQAKINVRWYDQGGLFDTPQIIGIAERRPEFVGAAEDLQTFINLSVRDAFRGGYAMPVGASGVENINISMPVTVNGKMTDGEIKHMMTTVRRELGRLVG